MVNKVENHLLAHLVQKKQKYFIDDINKTIRSSVNEILQLSSDTPNNKFYVLSDNESRNISVIRLFIKIRKLNFASAEENHFKISTALFFLFISFLWNGKVLEHWHFRKTRFPRNPMTSTTFNIFHKESFNFEKLPIDFLIKMDPSWNRSWNWLEFPNLRTLMVLQIILGSVIISVLFVGVFEAVHSGKNCLTLQKKLLLWC